MNQKIAQQLLNEMRKSGIEKVVAGAIIFFEGSKVLLLERLPDDFIGGLIELPSGTIEAEESVIDGLKREIKEETNLEVLEIGKYVGHFDYFSFSGKKIRQYNFVVSVHSGEVRVNPAEHTRSFYVDPLSKEFQALNISPETKEAIENSL